MSSKIVLTEGMRQAIRDGVADAFKDSDSDACARGELGALGASCGIVGESPSENTPQNLSQTSQSASQYTGRFCKCGVACAGKGTRCKQCAKEYRKELRNRPPEPTTIEFSVRLCVSNDKTWSVLVMSTRPLEGDEATRAKMYGPYASRKEALAAAKRADEYLEVVGFANGW